VTTPVERATMVFYGFLFVFNMCFGSAECHSQVIRDFLLESKNDDLSNLAASGRAGLEVTSPFESSTMVSY
jgi:hypothetical protein